MKKYLFIISLLFFSLAVSQQSDAQFFKKLADKVTERVEDKVINDAGDAAVKGVDKAEDETGKAVKGDGKKTRRETRKTERARAERQAAKQRALRPVSANKPTKKTASLPQNYTLKFTGSGPDLYLEYQMNMEGKQSSEYQMDIHLKMVASPATGMGRSEMVMNMPVVGEMRMVTLTNAAKPLQITLLNERKKQYSVIDLSGMDDAESAESYTVTKLGEEKLHGLHCIHSKAVNQDGHAFEIWTTTEVPGYEKMVALYSQSQQMGAGDLWKKMQEAGVAGFMVKLKVEVKGGTTVMELTEMKNIEAPESLFQIPAGYEEKEGGWAKRFMKR